MLDLLMRVQARLISGSYANEAAVSHSVVIPILRELGWDSSDPDQIVPENPIAGGRVDFALLGSRKRPAVFIEVKHVGHTVQGDRQLFEYAFHAGVPLCVLTDGREWSFYLPSGQGSYEDRRVYRLQLDEREPSESEAVLSRYLDHDRVLSETASSAAQSDYYDAARRREAAATLPRAWEALVAEEELLLDLLADKVEGLCNSRPKPADVLLFLRDLRGITATTSSSPPSRTRRPPSTPPTPRETPTVPVQEPPTVSPPSAAPESRGISYVLFGKSEVAASASAALIHILRAVCSRDPTRIRQFAEAAKGRTRNHVARSAQETYPARPDLAYAKEFLPGWFVGLNIANREKMRLLRAVCETYEISMPGDLTISLPNPE